MSQSFSRRQEGRPRRFQFSLRTLLLLFVIASLVSVWVGLWCRQKVRREQPGQRSADGLGKARPLLSGGSGSPLRLFFEDVARIRDADLMDLKELAKQGRVLQELNLHGAPIGDAGLVHLQAVPELKRLWLDRTRVTDDGLVHLQAVPKLKELSLNRTRVGDDGLRRLVSQLPELQIVWLAGTDVTDDGLAHLKKLKHLESLNLVDTGITDAGLAHISELKMLSSLELGGTKITDSGLVHLQKLRRLRILGLGRTECSREAKDRLQVALPDCLIGY